MKILKAIKIIFYISLIGFLVLGCKKEAAELPFYNSADWESQWIAPTDPDYDRIHTIEEFAFQDQNNQRITNDNFDGRVYVANFFFTTCPGICPKMTENMMLIQDEFEDSGKVKILSHSVTPWIDTVKQLKRYAKEYNINDKMWHLATGPKETIYSIARNSYFIEGEMGLQLSSDDFLHTENFILVDQKRRVRGIYNGTIVSQIELLIEDINSLIIVN